MYLVIDKTCDYVIDAFEQYWQADLLYKGMELPEGYTFRSDVYSIVDENRNEVSEPLEEKKPFFIANTQVEILEDYCNLYGLNLRGEVFSDKRIAFFDTHEEALAALGKYKSQKIKHKSAVADLCDIYALNQFYIEEQDPGTRRLTLHEFAEYEETDRDFRENPVYQEYDCYGKLRESEERTLK